MITVPSHRKPHEIKPTPETRVCINCGEELPLSAYSRAARAIDKCRSSCKACIAKKAKEKIAKMNAEEYEAFRARVNNWFRTSDKYKTWKEENRDKLRSNYNKHVGNWTEEDKERRRKYEREYRLKPSIRLHRRITQGVYFALKENKSGKKWEAILGYTTQELHEHIEALFEPGMSWKNMGEWHIDHYIPKSWFGNDEESVIAAWNIFNLQPKWAEENLSKNNLYVG